MDCHNSCLIVRIVEIRILILIRTKTNMKINGDRNNLIKNIMKKLDYY